MERCRLKQFCFTLPLVPNLDAPSGLPFIAWTGNGLYLFERAGFYAARVLIASSVGSHTLAWQLEVNTNAPKPIVNNRGPATLVSR